MARQPYFLKAYLITPPLVVIGTSSISIRLIFFIQPPLLFEHCAAKGITGLRVPVDRVYVSWEVWENPSIQKRGNGIITLSLKNDVLLLIPGGRQKQVAS